MARVKVNLPNLPRGADVEIPGLGVFKNGSARSVDEEQVENWRWYHQHAVDVGDRPEGGVAAVEYQRGPTLTQAFEHVDYIDVLDDEPPPKQQKAEEPKAEQPAKADTTAADQKE